MSPLLVVVFYLPLQDAIVNTLAAFVFLVASVTDFLDGFMARKYNWQSRFGAFLDPVADKVLVMTALLLLLSDERVPIIATLIIAYREICVSALREWMAGVGKFGRLNITIISKIKTGMQMAALTLLLYQAEILTNSASPAAASPPKPPK